MAWKGILRRVSNYAGLAAIAAGVALGGCAAVTNSKTGETYYITGEPVSTYIVGRMTSGQNQDDLWVKKEWQPGSQQRGTIYINKNANAIKNVGFVCIEMCSCGNRLTINGEDRFIDYGKKDFATNELANISFKASAEGTVTFKVFDCSGKLIGGSELKCEKWKYCGMTLNPENSLLSEGIMKDIQKEGPGTYLIDAKFDYKSLLGVENSYNISLDITIKEPEKK